MQAQMIEFNREIFQQLKSDGYEIVTPGFLRIEKTIRNSQSEYAFDILANGNETVTERKLNRNDVLVMSEIGLLLGIRTANKAGAAILESYPSHQTFNVAGVTPSDLHIFYNGRLRWEVDQKVWIEALDTRQFLHIPETQRTVSTNYNKTTGDQGFIPVVPNFVVSGRSKNQVTLNVPTFSGIGLEPSGSEELFVALIIRGFLVPGAARE